MASTPSTPPTPQAQPAQATRCSDPACAEMTDWTLSRRSLLSTAGAAGAFTAVFGDTHVRAQAATAAPAASSSGAPVLLVLSLRGGADGLSLVVPHGDPAYYRARPRLAVPADRLLVADEMFGLHPALAPLADWWRSGRVAAVHAAGLPARNRSHFAAMEEVEDADPTSSLRVGWLNRLIGLDGVRSPLQAVHMGGAVPPSSLAGPEPSLSVPDPGSVRLAADGVVSRTARRRSLRSAWGADGGADLAPLVASARSVPGLVDAFVPATSAASSVTFPGTFLGKALSFASRTIRAGVGAQVVTVDHGGWDMHADLGTVESGDMRTLATELGEALAAFLADLGPHLDRTTVVVLSEFGRRTEENSSMGLDHGYGNAMLLAGAGVLGGRVHGTWPGLTLGSDADLLVTTDYRSVLAEVVRTRFGRSTSAVFPGFSPAPVGAMAG
ncbi:DUF1501 domain-containing protein [Nocardioides sp. zg-DK7169]|uniref:DUF1501 domain-containing protein n=1 Tax=Nocardioides sp. zg-DK7169 TaxID=2736600 RepID=UPI001551D652|nr:DUF1501 domain-containing protein [Nocardioides sp. zg-DK7169]NPC96715.1 DUF1501 domain-containing protein [Nocardioides sp. zg-DK7169]